MSHPPTTSWSGWQNETYVAYFLCFLNLAIQHSSNAPSFCQLGWWTPYSCNLTSKSWLFSRPRWDKTKTGGNTATWFVGTGLAILRSQYVKLIEFVRKVTYSSPRLQIIYSSFSWYLAMCSPPTVSHPSGKKRQLSEIGDWEKTHDINMWCNIRPNLYDVSIHSTDMMWFDALLDVTKTSYHFKDAWPI